MLIIPTNKDQLKIDDAANPWGEIFGKSNSLCTVPCAVVGNSNISADLISTQGWPRVTGNQGIPLTPIR
jgi:hypothetical protein